MKLRQALAILLLALASVASAGQAACRIEIPTGVVCFAEETIISVHNAELTAGAEIAYHTSFFVTPFIAIAWYDEQWFSVIEVRVPTMVTPAFEPKFSLALTIGMTW